MPSAREHAWSLRIAAFLAIALVAFTSLVGLPATRAGAEGVCDGPDRLRKDKDYKEALRMYALVTGMSLAQQQAPAPCAINGVLVILTERASARAKFDRATRLEADKKTDEALALFKEAAAQDPQLEQAGAAVKRIENAKNAKPDQFGFMKWAKDKTATRRGQFKNMFDDVKDVGQYAIPTVAGLLIVWVLARLVRRWLFGWSLDIQDFDKGATGLELGKSLSSLVEERYRWHKTRSESEVAGAVRRQMFRPELVTEPPGQIDLPDTQVPQFKVVTALLNWLLPPLRARSIYGYLQFSEKQGAGISLSLSNSRKRVLQTITIWESEFAPPKPKYEKATAQSFYSLADAAAIWLQFVTARSKSSFLRGPAGRNPSVLPVFGTNLWRSYALHQSGMRALEGGSAGGAHRLFKRAIDLDPNHYGVAANLAAVASDGEVDWALGLLRYALSRVDQLSESYLELAFGEPRTNLAMWYSLLYQEAATLDYLDRHQEAMRKAVLLQRRIESKLSAIRAHLASYESLRSDRRKRAVLWVTDWVFASRKAYVKRHELADLPRLEVLQRTLQRILPMVKAMRASIVVNRPAVSPALIEIARELLPDAPPANLNLRVQYNVACFEATIARHLTGNERALHLKRALEHLKIALDTGIDLVASADRDPSLEPLRKGMPKEFKAVLGAASGAAPAGDAEWT